MHLDFYSKTSRQSKILLELVFNQKRHSCYRKQKKLYQKILKTRKRTRRKRKKPMVVLFRMYICER